MKKTSKKVAKARAIESSLQVWTDEQIAQLAYEENHKDEIQEENMDAKIERVARRKQ